MEASRLLKQLCGDVYFIRTLEPQKVKEGRDLTVLHTHIVLGLGKVFHTMVNASSNYQTKINK